MISLDAEVKHPLANFPEMRVTSGGDVLVKNAKNHFEVWLNGSVDYRIYLPIRDCSTCHWVFAYNVQPGRSFPDTMLESTLDDTTIYARNRIMLIEEL